jgi:hypothetical protein
MAITKILVPVTGNLDQTNTLDVAVAVGRVLHSQVEVLYIEIDPEAVGTTGYEGNTIGWIYANRESLRQLLNATRDAARAAFHAWAERSEIKLMPPKAIPAITVLSIGRNASAYQSWSSLIWDGSATL